MTTTIFKSGNSLCVRLPKGFELPVGRVHITKKDNTIEISLDENGYPADFWDYFTNNGDSEWERPEQPPTPEIEPL